MGGGRRRAGRHHMPQLVMEGVVRVGVRVRVRVGVGVRGRARVGVTMCHSS